MGEITTAHIAVLVGLLGIVMPVVTALVMFLLQRMFGSGDKATDEIDELKDKVHALELAQVGQYATKADVEALRRDIRGEFERLGVLLQPVFKQFQANAVMQS